MANRRITYGDIFQLLEAEGFQVTFERDQHVRFDHAPSAAAIILPRKRTTASANGLNLSLLQHTLVDFGILSKSVMATAGSPTQNTSKPPDISTLFAKMCVSALFSPLTFN